jgi:hypothetical protein
VREGCLHAGVGDPDAEDPRVADRDGGDRACVREDSAGHGEFVHSCKESFGLREPWGNGGGNGETTARNKGSREYRKTREGLQDSDLGH